MSVKVIGTVTHSGEKNFPVFVDSDGLVSFCIVADNTARDAIATYRRKQGLHCYVISGNNTYTLGADLTTWTLKDSSSYILSSEKGAANGVAPLNANGKIDGSYLQSLFINAAIGVADIAEMLATSSVAGNLFVVEDASGDPPNTGSAVYYKNNNDDPSDITDFLQLDFGASVVSVNGETGVVTISIASLLAEPANVTAFDAQVAASAYATATNGAIATIQSTVSGHTSDISDLDTNKVDKVTGKALSENDYTDADKAKVDILTTDGDGNSYLANDGEYKSIPEAGIEEAPLNGEPHARQDGEWVEIPAQTTATLGAVIAGAADATPNNTDVVATVESSVVKKITWTNVKAFLKTHFDTLYQAVSGKDATGGYVGLTLFKINFKNAANTFTSFFANANTAARTYTFQDRDGTIADDTDLGLLAPKDNPTFTGTVTMPSGAALGTPASIILTNATGLPISTGVSGLGSGIATWLATPSWTNFDSAITGTAPYWSLGSGGTLTGNNAIIGTGYTFKINYNSLGTTQTDGYGIWLANTTSASSGNQQISPSLVLEGQGWKTTATAASQSLKWKVDVLPIQGASAPQGSLRFSVSTDGGAYTDRMVLTSTGIVEANNFGASTGDLNLRTSGSIRATISSTGLITIGTASSVVIGHTSLGLSTTRLQVRGIGTTTGTLALFEDSVGTARMTLLDNGSLGVGIAPTSVLHIKAGTATASTAPLKLTSGTNLTTAETGAFEYNGTNLFFTPVGTTRLTVNCSSSGASAPATNAIGVVLDYYGTSATRVLTTPDSWELVVIDGTTYKRPLYL